MEDHKLAAFLLLSGIKALSLTRIPNEYCPKTLNCDICESRPWWLIEIERVGVIKIGWRKRVINIDWSKTGHVIDPATITPDEVTKEKTYIYAYGYGKAMEYLYLIIHFIRVQKRDAERAEEDDQKQKAAQDNS